MHLPIFQGRFELRWQIAIAYASFLLIGAHDGSLGVLLFHIQMFYQVNPSTVSTLFLCLTLGYLLVSFNTGILLQKLSIQRFLQIGLCCFIVGTGAQILHTPFPVFLASMVVIGVGIASVDTGLNTYFASFSQNTIQLNYLHAFYGGGALLGPIFSASFIALDLSWQEVYLVWALLAFLLLIGLFLTYASAHYQPSSAHTQHQHPLVVLRMPFVWIAAAFLFVYVGLETNIGNWGYSFLVEQRAFPLFTAGWLISGYWFGLTLGRLIFSQRVNVVGKTRLLKECLVGVIFGVLVVVLIPTGWGSGIGLCIIGFFLGPIYPTMIAWVPGRIAPALLASTIGILTSLGNIGSAILPWMGGQIIQHFTLNAIFFYILVLSLVLFVIWQFLLQIKSKEQPHNM